MSNLTPGQWLLVGTAAWLVLLWSLVVDALRQIDRYAKERVRK